IWGLGEARGWPIKQTLASYSVDAKYSDIWILSGYNGPVIGAGDVLFSTLDAGIVSLAIPMYRYRRDLYNRFTDMLVVLFPCAMLSLFVWPSIAHLIGIAPERSLAFASRFMSTPLAIELSLTIGADESITVILVVITGILISVFKDQLFRLLRV
ncbi:LrgB family protein, partial [Klebsiella pneumoniae]|uniref:LrgB family protein n=1 Tax=Klebsiella pneumoniae TaxID=573 RepID=UPI00406AB0E6